MDFSTTNVENAVLQFYHSGSVGHDYHKWLTMAQTSKEAWNFTWDMISTSKSHEIQFFGASCLALKVSKNWNEVPVDQIGNLRKRLLDLLLEFHGSKIVRTRLCVAVAGMVNHCISHQDQWPNPIGDIIGIFQRHSNVNMDTSSTLILLLELLTVIPEEFGTLIMAAPVRSVVRGELGRSLSTEVLPLISNILIVQNNSSQVTDEVKAQATKCLQSWVQFGISLDQIEPLLMHILSSVLNEDLFDCALDALSSIISHPDTSRYPNTLKQFLPQLLTLDQMLARFMAEEAYEMATPIICLFITVGESHSRFLIDWSILHPDGLSTMTKLLTAICTVSGCKDQFPTQETISEMPFGFWYILQDDIIASEPPQLQQCLTLYSPIYLSLLDIFLRKSMYSLNEFEWTSDQREAFRCYRTDIADTIMYSYNILRVSLLESLLRHLEAACEGQHWPYLEAVLYSWSAVAESMSDDVEDYGTTITIKFLSKLPSLPYNGNIRLISSALDCIGGFSEWLNTHPQLLPQIIPLVLSALPNAELSVCATMALKDITRDCADSLHPFIENIILACQNAISTGLLKSGECIRLIFPIGKMLGLIRPVDKILPRLEPILAPLLSDLQNLSVSNGNPQTKLKIIHYLKMLTVLFQTLVLPSQPQPLLGILSQLLVLLRNVGQAWSSDIEVSEEICNCLKQIVTTLDRGVEGQLKTIIDLMLICFQNAPNEGALDLCRQLFVMFNDTSCVGSEAGNELQSLLHSVMSVISAKSLNIIQNFQRDLSEKADLIAGFFKMMTQILKKQPWLLLSVNQEQASVDLQALFSCSTACLCLPEGAAVKSCSAFISHFVAVSVVGGPRSSVNGSLKESGRLLLVSIVSSNLEPLFLQLMNCLGTSCVLRAYVDHYADIMLSLTKHRFEEMTRILGYFVGMDNFPSVHISREQKHSFVQMILRQRTSKRKLVEVLREFAFACGGVIVNNTGEHRENEQVSE